MMKLRLLAVLSPSSIRLHDSDCNHGGVSGFSRTVGPLVTSTQNSGSLWQQSKTSQNCLLLKCHLPSLLLTRKMNRTDLIYATSSYSCSKAVGTQSHNLGINSSFRIGIIHLSILLLIIIIINSECL
jgi:hypothetical protein